jgi:hypothetical protein
MEVQVRFRYNKRTGEIELFEVDDVASTLPYAEHNRVHDAITSEIGAFMLRRPRIVEAAATESEITAETPETAVDPERRSQRQRER